MRFLVLFDVDGTLFLTDDPLAGKALRETLEERFDIQLPADPIAHVDHAGQTSLRIARLVLEAAGRAGVDAGELAAWCPCFAERYLELLAGADTSDWRAAPDAEGALERLALAGTVSRSSPGTRRRSLARGSSGSAWSGSSRRARARSAARASPERS